MRNSEVSFPTDVRMAVRVTRRPKDGIGHGILVVAAHKVTGLKHTLALTVRLQSTFDRKVDLL